MKYKTLSLKLALMASVLTVSAPFAAMAEIGPGITPITTSPSYEQEEQGPGVSPAPSIPNPELTENPSNYYFNQLENPIVTEHEKYSYDQMSQDLQALKERYGSHVSLVSIGKTADNRELYGAIVGNPNASKHVLIQGAIHGREYITTQLMMKQLEYALAFYETGTYEGQALSSYFDQVAVHFLPMMNPDGVSISQWGEGGIGSEEILQTVRNCYQYDLTAGRTSASYESYLRTWKANGRGVDLNYSFDTNWANTQRSAVAPSYSGYKGATPLTEPEAIALASYIDKYSFKAVINYHAMGQVIYWDTPENRQTASSLNLAQILSQSTGYQVMSSQGLLGFKDWVQSKEVSIPSVTLEIGRTSCPVPISEFPEIWTLNRRCILQTVEFALKN